MNKWFPGSFASQFLTVLGGVATIGVSVWFFLPTETVNTGFRGTGMAHIQSEEQLAEDERLYAFFEEEVYTEEPYAPEPGEALAKDVYENVQVLGEVTEANFTRLMAAITQWVSPEQGCAYCHANADDGEFASDDLYTKVVSRWMLQMTRNINANWDGHVAPTGVTCYTCHRGQNVPQHHWFNEEQPRAGMMVGADIGGQNRPNEEAYYASLPAKAFERYLSNYDNIVGVQVQESRVAEYGSSIKHAEYTYSLMMHYSAGLGVNCTYCHNSRAFGNWEQSTPVRATALLGQQMTQEQNVEYLIPLRDTYPDYRLGPTGDAPKINCLSCHFEAPKPMQGYSIIDDWPELKIDEGAPDYGTTEETAGSAGDDDRAAADADVSGG